MSYKILITELRDFDLITLREQEQIALDLDPNAKARFIALCSTGSLGTVMFDGRILCIMGYHQLWGGTWEAYVFPSTYIYQYPKQYLRIIKKYVVQTVECFCIKRLQTVSLSDPITDRWMRFLGFESEGIMRAYGPEGLDYTMWSLIR